MKKGYHSTQTKYFGTIPRSEFYGVALGYALGLIITGLFRIDTQIPHLVLAVAGYLVGYIIDVKFFLEKDEPEADSAEPETDLIESESGSVEPAGEALLEEAGEEAEQEKDQTERID